MVLVLTVAGPQLSLASTLLRLAARSRFHFDSAPFLIIISLEQHITPLSLLILRLILSKCTLRLAHDY